MTQSTQPTTKIAPSIATGWRDNLGAAISHPEVIAKAAQSRIVLLGEQHDRYEIHRWQLHVAAGLAAHRPIVMGFEMFPAHLDPILADWVAGELTEAEFLSRSEWGTVWGFAADLYLPLFRICREMGWPMRGLNVARSLVRRVGAEGWESIPEAEREGLTPARPSPEAYRRFIFDLTGGVRPGRLAQSHDDPAFDRFIRAQEVWDRAFATNLAKAAADFPAALVIGIIGMGHLQFGGGVSWQLRDLGVTDVAVLLPHHSTAPLPQPEAADYHFTLVAEPPDPHQAETKVAR